MLIGRIQGATRALGAPRDWNEERDGPCGALPIRDEMHGGAPAMVSAWLPESAEMAALAAGAPILLRIIGQGHPPVCVYVGDPPA